MKKLPTASSSVLQKSTSQPEWYLKAVCRGGEGVSERERARVRESNAAQWAVRVWGSTGPWREVVVASTIRAAHSAEEEPELECVRAGEEK